jgi:hypothetical protein
VYTRLPGLTLTPDLEVSDQLISECVHVYESNKLKYVPWERCGTTCLEMTGAKLDEAWVKAPGGFMKCEAVGAPAALADTSSQHHLNYVLMRRGLAFEMSDLMTYECHERLRADLMAALDRPALQGFQRVTKSQARNADEIAFGLMKQLCPAGVKKVARVRPLDATIEKILSNRDYNQALTQLQTPSGAGSSGDKRQFESEHGQVKKEPRNKKRKEDLKRREDEWESSRQDRKGKGKR